MKITYFEDTDTAHIVFANTDPVETREMSENMYVDIDAAGNPVSMTIEHAKTSGALTKLEYEQVAAHIA
ncbi:DUF2283 domain-containing protein [Spirochaeta africana]|uniref:DUF2283 domain-containing protein n=1 Tax=Spirochaeta africana (strain ATCC 700263 / DSM 8902 / Z-7692) TaxID=889378 RepID=H9UHI4_SPIAZ|nr:DUF2283 domain-containing protein [Spirochaeta africana]AFG36977.1 Protein of unknown function (DUF2283) [Spirochaeta africana DSM 8902]